MASQVWITFSVPQVALLTLDTVTTLEEVFLRITRADEDSATEQTTAGVYVDVCGDDTVW